MAECPRSLSGRHYWILLRTEKRGRRTYYFYECANCNAPRMEIG